MAPERQSDLAQVAFRAFVAGSAACFMTACIAGEREKVDFLSITKLSHYNRDNRYAYIICVGHSSINYLSTFNFYFYSKYDSLVLKFDHFQSSFLIQFDKEQN